MGQGCIFPTDWSVEVQPEQTRFCWICKTRKPEDEGKLVNPEHPNGTWICFGCTNLKDEASRLRRQRSNLAYRLKKLYGLSIEQYDAIFAVQGEVCAICQTSFPGPKNWTVDHDHESGLVRGILCHSCNLMLGHYDNVELVKRLLDYLVHPPADSVL